MQHFLLEENRDLAAKHPLMYLTTLNPDLGMGRSLKYRGLEKNMRVGVDTLKG